MKQAGVLVTRPGEAGAHLAEQLVMSGFGAWHGPTLAIDPMPLVADTGNYDLLIFISPNAVVYSLGRQPDFITSGARLIAVGPGTADKLVAGGAREVIMPRAYNSEGLLALAELRQVMNRRILIVKGEGGRPLLYDTLVARGAVCDQLDVYRRCPADIDVDTWNAWGAHGEHRWLTVASVEALASFDEQCRRRRQPKPDLVFTASKRITESAIALGYTEVVTAGGAANPHFIEAIEARYDNLGGPSGRE